MLVKMPDLKAFLFTLFLAVLGGAIFNFLGLPVPWLLGPMAATLGASLSGKAALWWPVKVRDVALIIVGYSIGLSFTKPALLQIIAHFPSIILMTFLLIGYCAVLAIVVSRLSGLDYQTALLGSIPGGLSQMIALSEEMKGTDSSAVIIFQVFRVLMIIFIVPFTVLHPFSGSAADHAIQTASNVELFPGILIFAPLAVAFAVFGRKLGLPTAYLTGPIIITAALTVSGVEGPNLPGTLMNVSQLMIGAYIGLMFKPGSIARNGRHLPFAVGSGIVLLAGSAGLAFLLKNMYGLTFTTSYLSMAPGGMDQMSIIAHETGADLSIVAGYQLFRVFFIFFAMPYLLRGLFGLIGRRQINKHR
ncbi:AbrB family transcriptional regulator [Neobacillus piezotolerans]|uniref:AbrB family transcriptional regulator n=1 Tax=Neobacillus piezotolerans TaxID=2259171 RepID=A0A3D8GQU4_9BACI|nr:AbrB family transcriptional regulator [Neobacillus piezotolerans]RDU36864.1 AbrB family transcriptional regulator [Neobacillus piezotolerans]